MKTTSEILTKTFENLMKTHGWNQTELGDELGVDKSHITNLMKGEREPSKELLLKVLSVIPTVENIQTTVGKQKFSVMVIPIIGIMDAENKVGDIVSKILEAVKTEGGSK